MGLVGALDTVLLIVALGGEQLDDAVRAMLTATSEWPGIEENGLPNLVSVLAHIALHAGKDVQPFPPGGLNTSWLSDS
jgi:hypothetical protein